MGKLRAGKAKTAITLPVGIPLASYDEGNKSSIRIYDELYARSGPV